MFLIPIPTKENNNQVMHDTLLTTLHPYISEQIAHYYGYNKQYDAEIVKIKRLHKGGYEFNVTVIAHTFTHAHNPPYGKETMTFYINPGQIKVLNFKHEGDKKEKAINQFYKDTLADIQQSFHLNLKLYRKYNYEQLLFLVEKQKEYAPLLQLIDKISVHNVKNDNAIPIKNTIGAITFIHENDGYILLKKSNGVNIMYQMKKKAGKWTIVEKKSKQGKKMKNELLWYM
jgi:hypothetical protein